MERDGVDCSVLDTSYLLIIKIRGNLFKSIFPPIIHFLSISSVGESKKESNLIFKEAVI